MMKRFFLILTAAILTFLIGCKKDSPVNSADDPAIKTFEVQGILREVSPDHRTATIQHQNIPGYMPAMTMPFNVKIPAELDGIEIGADITFNLVVRTNDEWIQDIHFLALRLENLTNNPLAVHPDVPELKPGELLPDGELLTENGKIIHFTDFRGQVLAFTFFFSRCPLPDFCPRMENNFRATRDLLFADANAPTNWQFLSISFDPEFDSPAVLSAYGNFARGTNTDRWLFATMPTNVLMELAPKLDLMVLRDGAGITHNLRTVVLDAQGRIARQLDGNQWTPAELAEAMRQAARGTTNSAP